MHTSINPIQKPMRFNNLKQTERNGLMMTLASLFSVLSPITEKLTRLTETIVFGARQDEMSLETKIARRRLCLEQKAREARWESARLLNPLH